jgi:Uri superfamily endonuclease
MEQGQFPESGRGTYILILHLGAPGRLEIGRLGAFDFPAGWYAYVGSAFQAGGLRGRLKHHLAPAPHPHWHIDYLRRVTVLEQIWYLASAASFEHTWALLLISHLAADLPVPRFGASDCHCPAHLFHFATCPDFRRFSVLTREQGDVKCWCVAPE